MFYLQQFVSLLNFITLYSVIRSQSFPFAVEDLNLNAVESLQGLPYVAIGKHLCGPATGNLYLLFLINLTVSLTNDCCI